MTFEIIGRGYGSTDVGGSLKCPRCNSKIIKRLNSQGPIDFYQCQNPRGQTNIHTGEWRACGTKFRYMRQSMSANYDQSFVKQNPGIALGTDPAHFSQPSYRKRKIR